MGKAVRRWMKEIDPPRRPFPSRESRRILAGNSGNPDAFKIQSSERVFLRAGEEGRREAEDRKQASSGRTKVGSAERSFIAKEDRQ